MYYTYTHTHIYIYISGAIFGIVLNIVSLLWGIMNRIYAILKEIHIYYFKVYKLDWIVKAM